METALLYVAGAVLLGLAGVGVGVRARRVSQDVGGVEHPAQAFASSTRAPADAANPVFHRDGPGGRHPDYRRRNFTLHPVRRRWRLAARLTVRLVHGGCSTEPLPGPSPR